MGKVTIPQSPSVTAPFTQGGLWAAGNRRLHLAPEGSIGEKEKSVKNRAALLHGLAFFLFDLLFGVPRGRATWAGVRCLGTARLFSLPFLVTKKEGLTEKSH
ncbi:MAG: hypothetical protein EGR85_11385 [Subdoligranulum sp.]|nr:hypothetical protein [Subdoligranulum sp.]